MEVTISRFKLAGTLFYFNCRWFDTYFEVDLSDGKYVWQGNATREYIEEELKPKGMDFSEYINLVKEAFAAQDLTKKKFSYGIQKGDTSNQLKLIWSIHLGEDDEEVKFAMQGLLIVERIAESRQVIQKYFDWLIDNKVKLEEENRELKRINKSVSNQRDLAIKQFDQLIIEKQCLETELYGKFVELLNEKKKKIRELKDELKARPFQRHHSQSIELQGSDDESESEDGLNSTMLQTGDSQSALEQRQLGSHSTATFNMSINHMATPSMDLLATEESAALEPVIRRRYRPNFPKQSTNVAPMKQTTEFGSPIQSPIKMLSPPTSTKKRKRSEMESPKNNAAVASKKSSKNSPDAKPSSKATPSRSSNTNKSAIENTTKISKNKKKVNNDSPPPAVTKAKNSSKNVSPPNSHKKTSPPTKSTKNGNNTPSKAITHNSEVNSPTAKKIGQNFLKKKTAASNMIQRPEPIRIAINNENIDTSNISIKSPSLSHNTNTSNNSNLTSVDLTNNPITSQLSSSYSDLPLKSPEKKTAQKLFKQPAVPTSRSAVKDEPAKKSKNSAGSTYNQPLNLTLEDDASELINMMSY